MPRTGNTAAALAKDGRMREVEAGAVGRRPNHVHHAGAVIATWRTDDQILHAVAIGVGLEHARAEQVAGLRRHAEIRLRERDAPGCGAVEQSVLGRREHVHDARVLDRSDVLAWVTDDGAVREQSVSGR